MLFGPASGRMTSVSTQFGNSTRRSDSMPLAASRSSMRIEMVETLSKRPSQKRSMESASFFTGPALNCPRPCATSSSKSCICSQAAAPVSRATNHAPGAHKMVGATTRTICGRQAICRNITGRLLSMKVNKCSNRVSVRGRSGTHSGQR